MADSFLHGDIVEQVGTIMPDDDVETPECITGIDYNHSSSTAISIETLASEDAYLPIQNSRLIQGSPASLLMDSMGNYQIAFASPGNGLAGDNEIVATTYGSSGIMSAAAVPVASVLPFRTQSQSTISGLASVNNSDSNVTMAVPVQTLTLVNSNAMKDSTVATPSFPSAPVSVTAPHDAKGCQLCKQKFTSASQLLSHMQLFHHVDTEHVVQNRAALDKRLQTQKLIAASSQNISSLPTSLFKKNVPTSVSTAASTVTTTSGINQQVDCGSNPTYVHSTGLLYRVDVVNESLTASASPPIQTITTTQAPDFQVNLESNQQKPKNKPSLLTTLLQQQLELMNGEPIIRSVDGRLTPAQERQAVDMIVTEHFNEYYCKMCLEKFNERETGIAHAKREHLGWKPFQCSNCPMRFATPGLRKTHKLALHSNVDQNALLGQSSSVSVEGEAMRNTSMSTITSATNTSTAKSSEESDLPLTYITPLGFYRDSVAQGSSAVAGKQAVEYDEVCILPDDDVPVHHIDVDNSKVDDFNTTRSSPVHLRIVETQQSQIVDTRETSNIPHTSVSQIANDYKTFVSQDGTLNDAQIEFANNMIEILPDGIFRCKICAQDIVHRQHARKHVRHLHLKEYYKCADCVETFVTRNEKDRHRAKFHKNKTPTQSVTIIQSQIYVNQPHDVSYSLPSQEQQLSVAKDPVGIHPTEIHLHLNACVEKFADRFRCKKCSKSFKARAHAISHCRQTHFGRSHMCNSCGYFFEKDLPLHRTKCNTSAQISPKKGPNVSNLLENDSETSTVVSNEVNHLRTMMENSIERIVIRNQNQSWDVNYQCQLCSSKFDKRSNAEAHLWIEHIRNEWALTSGSSNVDSIYLQFLQEQFTNPSASAIKRKTQKNITQKPSSDERQNYVFAGSIEKMRITEQGGPGVVEAASLQTGTEDSNSYISFQDPDNEEEMLFDPMAMTENQIFIEAGNTINIGAPGEDESGLSFEGINAALQCKVELEEPRVEEQHYDGSNDRFNSVDSNDNGYVDDNSRGGSFNGDSNDKARESTNNEAPFKVVSYSSACLENIDIPPIKTEPVIEHEFELNGSSVLASKNVKDISGSICESQLHNTSAKPDNLRNKIIGSGDGTSNSKIVASSSALSETELNQLNVKALRFIREKFGQYYCIVCQRKTKLRRQLVEHVRRVHLCGESDIDEGLSTSLPEGEESQRGNDIPDNEHRMYCMHCEEHFATPLERKFHERHCACRSATSASVTENLNSPDVISGNNGPLPTVEQRALRFIRPDKSEFICTICRIRATRADRLISHVSSIHFGDNSQKCPKCNKNFPDGVNWRRHLSHCKGGAGSVPNGPSSAQNSQVKSKSKFKKTGARSNYYFDSAGRLKKKPGRPFVFNVDNSPTNPKPGGKSASSVQKASISFSRSRGTTKDTVIDIVSDNEGTGSDNDNDNDNNSNDPDWEPGASASSPPPSPPHRSRSISPSIGVPPPDSVAKPGPSEIKTKHVAMKKTTVPPKPSLKLVTTPDASGRLTAEQIEKAKKMIIAWSVGGKYSFSKCSECSVLFTKYENAESHVRKIHFGEVQSGNGTIKETNNEKSSTKNKDEVISINDSENNITASKKRKNDRESDGDLAVSKKFKSDDTKDSDLEENVYCSEDDDGFSEINTDQVLERDADNKKESDKLSIPVSPSKAGSRRIRMSMTAISADVLKKKYMLPKRVSKVLTTLTSKEFSDAQSYILKCDKGGYECKDCGAKFPRLNSISRHVRQKHFVERPYHCLKCDKRFFHNNHYQVHKKQCVDELQNWESEYKNREPISPELATESNITSNFKPETSSTAVVKCTSQTSDVETVSVTNASDAEDPTKFMEKMSKKGGKRRYRCQICRIILSSFGSCRKHIQKIHFGNSPFRCDKCGELFRYPKTYRNHTKICNGSDKMEQTFKTEKDDDAATNVIASIPEDSASHVEVTEYSLGKPVDNRFTDVKHYVCKLCGEKLPDKPLVRYHLVSVHYGELQSMGQSVKVFDTSNDKLVDDLTVESSGSTSPTAASTDVLQSFEDTARLTRNSGRELQRILNPFSKVTHSSASELPIAAKSAALANELAKSSGVSGTSNNTIISIGGSLTNNSDLHLTENCVMVHTNEKELIASLPQVDTYKLPDGSVEIIKKTTVRIQPLRFNSVLPLCLLAAAKELCVKTSPTNFVCKKCGKSFGTHGGCYSHARIHHYGEHRHQCSICLKFLTDGLHKHMKFCQKQSAKLKINKGKDGRDVKLKEDIQIMPLHFGRVEKDKAENKGRISSMSLCFESNVVSKIQISNDEQPCPDEGHQSESRSINSKNKIKVNAKTLQASIKKGASLPITPSKNHSGVLSDEEIALAHSMIRECHEPGKDETKRYECTFCKLKDEKFARIRRHARQVHFGEKPYGCNYCGKRFAKTSGEREHSWTCSVKNLSLASESVKVNSLVDGSTISSAPTTPVQESHNRRKFEKKSKSKKSTRKLSFHLKGTNQDRNKLSKLVKFNFSKASKQLSESQDYEDADSTK